MADEPLSLVTVDDSFHDALKPLPAPVLLSSLPHDMV
jgi:hypothetical protein